MKADLILSGGTVITMDDQREIFSEGAVVVKGGSIVAVGPVVDLTEKYEAEETLDCTGRVIVPGLVNAHTHVPMSLLRGLADDLRLEVWLHGYMLPVERKFVSPEFCYWGTLLSCAEMIRSGVTCFADMYYYEDEVAKAAVEAGVRAVCAETLMRSPTPDSASYDEGLDRCREFVERWEGHELITPAVGPHSSYMCPPELLLESARLAREYDVPLLIHLSETKEEVEESRKLNGCGPVAYVDRYGVLETKAVAAHCVHVSQEEMELMARRGTGVVHNPTSNLKLASGVADVRHMLDLGLKVGLGTDGPASNNDQDMFEEMRLAALLAKGVTGDPTAVPARAALAMATIGGARALHMEDIIGSIEVGKRADLVVVDLDKPHVTPKFALSEGNVYAQLVYAAKSTDVCHVLVDGRLLMRDGEFLTVDVDAIEAEAQRMADEIGVFLTEREEDLLEKLVAIGGLKEHETFEVQVKVRLKGELP
ncbi:MAG: amidohydrolase, partial [Chloroflexota bacterium]|nr:amidohydrolase [Chloroflexota bacterium]